MINISKTDGKIRVEFIKRTASISQIYFSLIISFIGFLAPIIANSLAMSFSAKSIPSFLIFWGVSFYFLMLALWNYYGKEIIEIRNSEVAKINDFGLFKIKIDEIKFNAFFGVIKIKENNSEDRINIGLAFDTKNILLNYTISEKETTCLENEISTFLSGLND